MNIIGCSWILTSPTMRLPTKKREEIMVISKGGTLMKKCRKCALSEKLEGIGWTGLASSYSGGKSTVLFAKGQEIKQDVTCPQFIIINI